MVRGRSCNESKVIPIATEDYSNWGYDMEPTTFGALNIAAGWIFISLGIITGSIMGMYSFDGPFPTPPGLSQSGTNRSEKSGLAVGGVS